ncbi:hypothetical protein LXL04_030003 [Taraxacum kok-saghyz]
MIDLTTTARPSPLQSVLPEVHVPCVEMSENNGRQPAARAAIAVADQLLLNPFARCRKKRNNETDTQRGCELTGRAVARSCRPVAAPLLLRWPQRLLAVSLSLPPLPSPSSRCPPSLPAFNFAVIRSGVRSSPFSPLDCRPREEEEELGRDRRPSDFLPCYHVFQHGIIARGLSTQKVPPLTKPTSKTTCTKRNGPKAIQEQVSVSRINLTRVPNPFATREPGQPDVQQWGMTTILYIDPDASLSLLRRIGDTSITPVVKDL